MDRDLLLGIGVLAITVGLLVAAIVGEIKNPCVAYGSREFSPMSKVGDTWVAQYRRPCLKRRDD